MLLRHGEIRSGTHGIHQGVRLQETEKADDAQLKIARCYLALGEKTSALRAFQQLVDEYPKSEYVGTAKKEISYLRGL